MKFLFHTAVVIVGATGYFDIHKVDDEYICTMTQWKQYQSTGPGDITIKRSGKRWFSDSYHPDIVECLIAEIKEWEFNNK